MQPEQYRYIADLILWWQDNLRLEDHYLFIPALRRSLRLSDASHCTPIFTFADLSHDDIWGGWFGGIADFDASFVKRMKLLALTGITNNDYGKFPANYDMPLGWAKPIGPPKWLAPLPELWNCADRSKRLLSSFL